MPEITKRCPCCGSAKALVEFPLSSTTKSGRQSWCRMCHVARRLATKEERSTKQKAYYRRNAERIKEQVHIYAERNREKIRAQCKERYRENIVSRMLQEAQKRARRDNVPFELTCADIVIPTMCPVLGIPLRIAEGRPSHNSPSVDKIVPGQGYVRANVRVISWRANRLKSDATLAEIQAIERYMRNCGTEAIATEPAA